MVGALDRLRLLHDEWVTVGRFEVNKRTGEKRPIPGLELGALPEEVDTGSPWGVGTLVNDAWQATKEIPGVVADAGYFASQIPSKLIDPYTPEWLISALGGAGPEDRALHAGEIKDSYESLVGPYKRATADTGPAIPKFSDDPWQSAVRGGVRSLPQTLGIALTGGAGAVISGASQAKQAYDEMASRGVSDAAAAPSSLVVGTIQGLLDKIGAEGAFKGVTGNVFGRMAKGAAIEGTTEAAQEVVGLGGESLTGKTHTAQEVRDRISSAFSSALVTGGLLGGSPRVEGVNLQEDVPIPVAHQEAAAVEQKLFPQRRAADYARLAMDQGPKKALARGLSDLSMEMDPDIKWEMLLDDQTDLALGREWQKIAARVDADPSMAIVDVDLDGVKAGNDALGHDAADALIFKPSTDALHQVAAKYGISPRLRIRKGGDEFRIVVPANVAEQFSRDLQEAMPPGFIPLPPEAAAAAGMPDGAYIQHGASIGWGSTSQEADQSMYRAKEAKPSRGAVSPGQPPFVSQSQAEEQVIQHQADQARVTKVLPRYGIREERSIGPDAPRFPRHLADGKSPFAVSPEGVDEHLAQISKKTAPYSRTMDKRFSEAPTGPDWDPGLNWGELLGNDPDLYGSFGKGLDPMAAAAREVFFYPGWEELAKSAHWQASRIADQAGPGKPIDSLYGLERSIEVLPPGDPRSVRAREGREKRSPEFPGVPVSPWASPPKVELRTEDERGSPEYPPGRTATFKASEAAEEVRKRFDREWREKWSPPRDRAILADYISRLPQGIAEAREKGAKREEIILGYQLKALVENNPDLVGQLEESGKAEQVLSIREALAGTGALMAVPVDQINAAIDGARGVLTQANRVRQKYFTAEGNLPIPWMQAHEQSVQNQRAAKLEVDYMVQDYGKALAQEIKSGAAPEEINDRARLYIEGDAEVEIPEGMKPVLDRMRQYVDESISQELVDSGVAKSPEHAAEILRNKGKYLYRAFKMHTDPKFKESMVGTPEFEQAVDYSISREDEFLQGVVRSRNELAAEYESKLVETKSLLQAELMDEMNAINSREQEDLGQLEDLEDAFSAPGSLRFAGKEVGVQAAQERKAAKQQIRQQKIAQLRAIQEQYGKKVGIAKNRAIWAEKKITANNVNQNRRAEAAGRVGEMITFDPKTVSEKGFLGMSKGWLAKRKDIPAPYRRVMGEHNDPVAGLVISAERAARTIGKKRMWDDIILGSEGRDIFIGKPMPGYDHRIEGITFPDTNGTEQPVYTSKELKQALTDAFDTGHQAAGLWDMVNGGLKANATVLNLQGAMRNAESGLVPLMANGNLVPGLIKHGWSSFKAAAANASWGQKEARQEAIDAVRHGILGTTVDTGDLANYFRTITEDPVSKTPLRSALNFAQKAYAWGDNMAKLIAWKSERDRYAEAYGLDRDSPEVKARAAEVVKRTIQNYDRLPKWAQEARKSPAIGPFVSFPASVISNVGGIAQTVAEDLKSDNPKVRLAGWKRAAYATGTLGGLAFYETFARSFKDDDEDETAILDSARKMLPPWMKNSSLMLWGKSPGQLSVVDLSFLNYYDTVTRPVAMLLRGDLSPENIPSTLWNTGWDTAKKIFGEELALAAYADFTRGPVGGGPEIVNKAMSWDVGLWRTARYVMRTMAPGTMRSAVRILEAQPGHRLTEVVALGGPRVTTVPVAKAFDYSLHELADDRVAIRTSLQGALRSTALFALPEFKANVDGFVPSMTSIHAQGLENYQAAVRLGVEPQVARAQLADKFDKRGKIMASFLNMGAAPESAVQKAVEYEWNRFKPDLLTQVDGFKRAALEDYRSTHTTASQMEIERRRLELEDWGRTAKGYIESVQVTPPPAMPSAPQPNGPKKETALERLRRLGG